MKKNLCAGLFLLAATALLLTNTASAADLRYDGLQAEQTIDIARIHGALRLTPQQEPLWAPVEAALRDLSRRQAHSEQAGLVRRISRRVVSVVLDSVAVERLVASARPLLAALSDDQKRTAAGLAQGMGLGPVIAALN